MRIISLSTAIFLLAMPLSHAQVPDDEFVPEGPRGRWSLEQGQVAALRVVRGEVIATDIEREDDHVFYEYTIRQADTSVFEVEVNAANGKIYEIEAEYLSENPKLPAGIIGEELARSVAMDYVVQKGKGRLKPKIKHAHIDIYERELVYDVLVRKGVRQYKVFVGAFSGKVEEFEELD